MLGFFVFQVIICQMFMGFYLVIDVYVKEALIDLTFSAIQGLVAIFKNGK